MSQHLPSNKISNSINSGEILGSQMVGPDVSELIHLIAFAMQSELLIKDLSEMIASHPTLS
ncbi:unnamed protein product, partial [marine sediment metagenome]